METTNAIASKVPFRVSARTARLIGRENIANSKGAIIELVKNGYDADSKVSIVYFDNKYSTFQTEIDLQHREFLLSKEIPEALLDELYEKKMEEEIYVVKKSFDEEKKIEFKTLISKLAILYLVDSGEGMTQAIIRNHWMTIGTDNKATDIFTKSGRVKAGAKGIGRFALDKLGNKCEMTTLFNPENHESDIDEDGDITSFNGYKWFVNWEDFEGDFKTIDNVNAELYGISGTTLKEQLVTVLPELDLSKITCETDFQFGTILKITDLRDNWEDYFVAQVYTDLEVLVPPKESGEFEIYVFSSLLPEKYGEVLGSVCDDYDYKIHAVADDKQNVTITIYRSEYDVQAIDPNLFARESMQIAPFTKQDFANGKWESKTTFSKLMPGFAKKDEDNVFDHIGVFDFTFYFLKRQYNTSDLTRFFYRKFQANLRKDWLDKFGGVKLFRDNFRVRPYGETKDVAFDWLGLGNRKATSPAGIAKEEGGWRVEPENVAGAVKISRLTNVDFEDKSSREGLQESKTFQIFKQLLASIINVFENDRAHIAREMTAFDDIKFGPERDRQAAEKLAKRILANSRAKKVQAANTNENGNNAGTNSSAESSEQEDPEKEILASEIERQEEEIEKLKEEQKILRALASSGIVLASFSHDLSKLNDVLSSRGEKLKALLLEKISENDYRGIENRKNPFFQLEKMKKQDAKMQNWLNFSLGAARKDKRKRKQLFFKTYFSDLQTDWTIVFGNRAITLDLSGIQETEMRAFEIDFDSIFNNLFINSIDAFDITTHDRPRQIRIITKESNNEIILEYYDNGPGLSEDISNPDAIFEAMYTTKRNAHTGEEIGTGLGMWLVKAIVDEYSGDIKLLFPQEGFGIRISFPVKYKKQNV